MKKALSIALLATLMLGLTPGTAFAGQNWTVQDRALAATHKIRLRALLKMDGRWYEVSYQAHDDCQRGERFPACVVWYGRKSRSLFTDRPSHFVIVP